MLLWTAGPALAGPPLTNVCMQGTVQAWRTEKCCVPRAVHIQVLFVRACEELYMGELLHVAYCCTDSAATCARTVVSDVLASLYIAWSGNQPNCVIRWYLSVDIEYC